MRVPDIGAFAPLLLLAVALLDWNLISLLFLMSFLIIQYNNSQGDQNSWKQDSLWWFVICLATMAIVAESGFYVVWSMKMESWRTAGLLWTKLMGFTRLNPWKETSFIYILLAIQLAVIFVALISLRASKRDHLSLQGSPWRKLLSLVSHFGKGSQVQIVFKSAIPAVQLLVGVSRPSCLSLPFFMCSCIRLLSWCLTTNIAGIFWCGKPLLFYTALNIIVLYVYQLPVNFPLQLSVAADYFGLYKVSMVIGWPETIYGISLLAFYILFCSVIHDSEQTETARYPFSCVCMPTTYSGYTLLNSSNSMMEPLLRSQMPNSDTSTM